MTQGGTAAVFGATGQIGRPVVARLLKNGWSVRVFSRDPESAAKIFGDSVEAFPWNYRSEDWKKHIDGTDAVINLSGAPIFQKWKGNYRTEIVDSRVTATRQISDAICRAEKRPEILINGSAAGIYGYDSWDDRTVTENTAAGKDFWGEFVTSWEEAALDAEKCGTRVVTLRTSAVLSLESGALPQLVSAFNRGIGGPIRPGDQWFPWIHVEDEVGLIFFALENNSVKGPLNASSPEPERMRDFARTLGEALGKPSRIPIPITILRLMLGEVALILAKGKRIVPQKSLDMGYEFRFPDLAGALNDLLGNRQ